jgi:hypothetical protein
MSIAIIDGHVVDQPIHVLTETEADVVTKVLRSQGLRVEATEPDFFGVVHIWAKHATDTRGEVRTLRAFEAVTDSPIEYHPFKAGAK